MLNAQMALEANGIPVFVSNAALYPDGMHLSIVNDADWDAATKIVSGLQITPAPPITTQPKRGRFKDVADARRHGEMREGVWNARAIMHGGIVTVALGLWPAINWDRHVRRFGQPPHGLLGDLTVTFVNGKVSLIPVEVAIGALLVPIGIAIAIFGWRLARRRRAVFSAAYPRDAGEIAPAARDESGND